MGEAPSSNLGVPTISIKHLRLLVLAAVLALWQICGKFVAMLGRNQRIEAAILALAGGAIL